MKNKSLTSFCLTFLFLFRLDSLSRASSLLIVMSVSFCLFCLLFNLFHYVFIMLFCFDWRIHQLCFVGINQSCLVSSQVSLSVSGSRLSSLMLTSRVSQWLVFTSSFILYLPACFTPWLPVFLYLNPFTFWCQVVEFDCLHESLGFCWVMSLSRIFFKHFVVGILVLPQFKLRFKFENVILVSWQ